MTGTSRKRGKNIVLLESRGRTNSNACNRETDIVRVGEAIRYL